MPPKNHKVDCPCYPCGKRSFEARFWPKVRKTSGCWIWIGALQVRPEGQARYGRVQFRGRGVFAHRASYEHFIGPIPEGMYILHECDNPRCVRPDHLALGTQADNLADMRRKGRGRKSRPTQSPQEVAA